MKHAEQIIFGLFDGLTNAVGIVVAIILGSQPHALVAVITALAIGEAIGMGTGEYLADNSRGIIEALVIAASAAVGAYLPAIPFFFLSRGLAISVALLFSLAAALSIAAFRAPSRGRRLPVYIQTLAILITAVSLTTLTSLLLR